MSMSESGIGAPGAAPPVSAPPAAPSAPASVPATPAATPAAASTPAPVAPAAPSASDSLPTNVDAVTEAYHQKLARLRAEESAPVEATPQAEPLEQPAEPITEPPAEEPVPAEQAATDDEAETEESDDEQLLTTEQIEALRIPKSQKAKIAKMVTAAQQMQELLPAIGGEIGVNLAKELLPIIWKNNPTEEDAHALLDALVLPEKAGAADLVRTLSKTFVTTALYDPTEGVEFADQIIHGEWGDDSDGNPVTLAVVDKLVKAFKGGLLNLEWIDGELEGQAAPAEPTEREQELQRKLDEREATDATKTEEQTREREKLVTTYKTQAKGFISRFVMKPVMPLAQNSGWMPGEGETGPQVEQKQFLGQMVSTYINLQLEGSREAPNADYAEMWSMVVAGTAFDEAGRPTPRFQRTLEPLQTKAKAMFAKAQRILNPALKFAATTSRNAQLAKKNGRTETPVVPPLAVVPPKDEGRQKTTDELLALERQKLQAKIRESQEAVGVL